MTALANLRLGQRNARGANTLFNGQLSVLLIPVDVKKLTFNVNIKAMTGDTNTPFVEYTPCNDYGEPKVFSAIDDVVTWLKGAYLDILGLSFTMDTMVGITNVFIPPTDSIKYATSQKAKFTKLRDGMTDNLASVNAQVAADIASGWNLGTAHPALQAKYAEDVKAKNATQAIYDFYVAEIARNNAIINP